MLLSATVTVVLATLATLLATGLDAGASARPVSGVSSRVLPLMHHHGFADPSVVRYAGGYLAVSTGRGAPRATATSPTGPWTLHRRAMLRHPGWARSSEIWASDMVRVGHRWLLYYSALVRGLGAEGRCIGVAASRTALGTFHPVGHRPLVCPRSARTPRAFDSLAHRGRHLPHSGVIDPSAYRGTSGRRYLLYKTQGYPSTIRILPLTSGGARVRHHGRSKQMLRSRHIVENPVLVRRHRHYVLFTSEGFYGACHYRTTWRRTTHLLSWGHRRPHTLLQRSRTGVCGPGGADVVTRRHERPLVFFHGWTCRDGRPCPRRFHIDRGQRAHRSLYAAHLTWTRRGTPRVRGYLHPR
ncbi:MAG: family 43 glycosylhydrolase [Nocardioides sp.]